MKKLWAIVIWGVLIFAIGTYLDKVREMIMLGDDPMMTYFVQFGVGLVLAIAVVLMGRWMKIWAGRDLLGPGDWFMIGAVAWAIKGGFDWRVNPKATVDIQIHDTYFVIARLHFIGGVIVLYVLTGLIYYLGRGMNRIMGYVHFVLTHVALCVLFWVKYFNPAYDVKGYLSWRWFQTYEAVDRAYTVMALLVAAAQVLFVVNLFLMLFSRGRRRAANGRFR